MVMIMMRVGMIVVPGFDVMSFAPLSVFDAANITLGEQRYEVRVLSETGGRTRNSFGMKIVTEPLVCDEFDTIIVGTSHDIGPAPPGIIAFLQNASGSARRIASICIGAFTLAQAGLLDGRRATTHWLYSRELQSRFPKIKVEVDRIFIADGPVWTSAGMTAGIDLALGLVERDVGPEAARVVARALVVHHRRAGGGAIATFRLRGPLGRPSAPSGRCPTGRVWNGTLWPGFRDRGQPQVLSLRAM